MSLGTAQVCGVVNRRTKREADWENQLQNDFLDCEANVLRHLEARKTDPTSVSQSSRNSSRMASVRRTEAERTKKELIIRAEAEKRELDRQRAKYEFEARLKEEELNDKLAVAQGLTQLAAREEEEERSLDAEIEQLRAIDLIKEELSANRSREPLGPGADFKACPFQRRQSTPKVTYSQLPSPSQVTPVVQSVPNPRTIRTSTHKLPRITIPPFKGNFIKWPIFISNFINLIDESDLGPNSESQSEYKSKSSHSSALFIFIVTNIDIITQSID